MQNSRWLPVKVLGLRGKQAEEAARAEGLEGTAVEFRAQEIGVKNPLVDYMEMYRHLTTQAGGNGATNDDVRIAVALLDKLDQAEALNKAWVAVNRAEYSLLQRRLNDFRWRLAHKNVVAFLDDFRDAPGADPELTAPAEAEAAPAPEPAREPQSVH